MQLRRTALALFFAAGLAVAAAPAVAGRGGNGGGRGNGASTSSASISFYGGSYYEPGDQVSFSASGQTKTSLWVANLCRQNGQVIYEQYLPVDSSGVSGPFTLSFSGAADCTAYTWSFPDNYTPLSGGSMDYSVG